MANCTALGSISWGTIIAPLDEQSIVAASCGKPVRMAAIVCETCAGGLSVYEIGLLISVVTINIVNASTGAYWQQVQRIRRRGNEIPDLCHGSVRIKTPID